jgi:bifunctional isochorismate lyase/aryl carrier protein
MGSHTVTPYRMPTAAQLPSPARYGRCHAERSVLVIHDMQHGFLRAFAGDLSPAVELVHNIGKLRDTCRELGVPIVYSAPFGAGPGRWRGLDDTGDPSAGLIIEAVAPRPRDIRVSRWREDAFRQAMLRDLLDRHGRDQVIVTGLHARAGCLRTAMDARTHELEAFFVADAVADISRRHHDGALLSAAEHAVPTTAGTVIGELLGVLL